MGQIRSRWSLGPRYSLGPLFSTLAAQLHRVLKRNPELVVIESWRNNVDPWIQAIRGQEIEDRKLATNKAVIDVILGLAPKKVLDVGCGEGWLVRQLENEGIDVLGIDAIPDFIEAARNEGKGRFRILTYEELSPQSIGETFDVLVCNFSLFGNKSVSSLFRAAPRILNEKGSFVIQTLHPAQAQGEEDWSEGWREGSWTGFGNHFQDRALVFSDTRELEKPIR